MELGKAKMNVNQNANIESSKLQELQKKYEQLKKKPNLSEQDKMKMENLKKQIAQLKQKSSSPQGGNSSAKTNLQSNDRVVIKEEGKGENVDERI